MIKSKALVFFILLFAIGCASAGNRRPTVFVDQHNYIPTDILSQFLDRYYFLVDKEKKDFKKLLTDEERQVFTDKFWAERDTDPTTPENEYKQGIDERIDKVSGEYLFSLSGTPDFLFRTNGGFRGDMAHVFLLHGEPDAIDTMDGRSFADLMLWIYVSPENGNILYAFLFYRQGGGGPFNLFPQDAYKMDPCGAFNEIATMKDPTSFGDSGYQICPPNIQEVIEELRLSSGKGGILEGYIFAWALFNFSQDSSLLQGKALEPPKPASGIARQSKARVTGEAPELVGTVGTDYILASCKECNSLIPAELSLGERFTISGPWKNFDWTIKGEYLELSLKYRIILENKKGGKPIVLEDVVVMDVKKLLLDEHQEITLIVDLVKPEQVATIPSGTYRVSVYVKNVTSGLMTKKYNAWSKEFTK